MSALPSLTEAVLPARERARSGVAVIEVPTSALRVLEGKFPGATVLVVPPEDMRPEFIRLPKEGQACPVTGLPRSTLVDLLKQAGSKVNVRTLRKKGASTGIVLIDRESLVEFVNSLPRPDWAGGEEEEHKNE